MAIPTTTYDIATISNPSSALTDFTLIVDLSNMSSAWWSAVNTSDGTRGRASKGDGVTELACDWIDFDDTAETGTLRVKWSGTLASTGTQQVRIYPPNTANTAYAATDTYGRYNAYNDDWSLYYPLGGGEDRTSNGNDGTASGGVNVGGISGAIGSATTFDGADDVITASSSSSLNPGADDFSLLVIAKTNASTGGSGIIEKGGVFVGVDGYVLYSTSPDAGYSRTYDDPADTYVQYSVTQDAWAHLAVTFDRSALQQNYVDGSASNSSNMSAVGNLDNTNDFRVGRHDNDFWNGDLQEVQMHKALLSADWISQEYEQTSDNSTFWGAWVNVPVGGSEVDVSANITELETVSVALSIGKSISAETTESESITASLLAGKSISASISESEQVAAQILIGKVISAVANESEAITANLLTESSVQEVVITAEVSESESITAEILKSKIISAVVSEPESVSVELKSNLPLTASVDELEIVSVNLLTESSVPVIIAEILELSSPIITGSQLSSPIITVSQLVSQI